MIRTDGKPTVAWGPLDEQAAAWVDRHSDAEVHLPSGEVIRVRKEEDEHGTFFVPVGEGAA